MTLIKRRYKLRPMGGNIVAREDGGTDEYRMERMFPIIFSPSAASVCLLLGMMALPAASQERQQDPIYSSTQLIVVTTADWNAVEGNLERYERSKPGKSWKAVGTPVTVVVGKNGLGWGEGLVVVQHGSSDPIKHEGDGKAPAGVFRLSSAFGYASQPQSGWKMPYVELTKSVECVDDTNSKFYNRVLDRNSVSPDWNSSEHMLRSDELYRWGIVVAHNAAPSRPGGGSCIFMHIWRGPGQGTVGCTAMPREQLEGVLAWLNPAKGPLLVQLPAGEYRRLQKTWLLPKFIAPY